MKQEDVLTLGNDNKEKGLRMEVVLTQINDCCQTGLRSTKWGRVGKLGSEADGKLDLLDGVKEERYSKKS